MLYHECLRQLQKVPSDQSRLDGVGPPQLNSFLYPFDHSLVFLQKSLYGRIETRFGVHLKLGHGLLLALTTAFGGGFEKTI